jgi:TrkA domain protein
MDIREADLPGVGRKFALTTNEGDRLTIIIHNTGAREIYNFQKGDDFPFHALRLEDQEARQLSAILGGAYFQPSASASMDLVLEQLSIEWLKVGGDSKLAGKSIAELDIRKNTGASVLAVLRGKQVMANPEPAERIEGGDTVVVAGTADQVNRFLAFARGQ